LSTEYLSGAICRLVVTLQGYGRLFRVPYGKFSLLLFRTVKYVRDRNTNNNNNNNNNNNKISRNKSRRQGKHIVE